MAADTTSDAGLTDDAVDPFDTSAESASDSSSDISKDEKEELTDEIGRLRQQLHDVTEDLNERIAQLALSQTRRPTVYSDQYFETQLDSLRGMIRNWCISYFNCAEGHWKLSAERKFGTISPDWRAYLEDGERRPWLVQAKIWTILYKFIFGLRSKKRFAYVFVGSEKQNSIDNELAAGLLAHYWIRAVILMTIASKRGTRDNRIAYLEWRALTFNLMFQGKGENIRYAAYLHAVLDKHKDTVYKKIWDAVRGYRKGDIREAKLDAKDSLHDLVAAAIYLDLDIRKYSCDLEITTTHSRLGDAFNAIEMDDVLKWHGSGTVGLVVSPALSKFTLPHDHSSKVTVEILRKPQVCSGPVLRAPQSILAKTFGAFYTMESSSRTGIGSTRSSIVDQSPTKGRRSSHKRHTPLPRDHTRLNRQSSQESIVRKSTKGGLVHVRKRL